MVTNENRQSLNNIQFGETAAEIKEQAKLEAGSLFLVDQRKNEKGTKKDRKVIDIKNRNPVKQKKAKKATKATKSKKVSKAAKGE